MCKVKKIEIECSILSVNHVIEKINKLKEVYPKSKIYLKFTE